MSAYQNRRIFATLPRTERGRPIVLGADPKGKNFLYTHGNSVIIRDLASPEISDVYTQHSCQVSRVLFFAEQGINIMMFAGERSQVLTLGLLHRLC